MTHIVISIDSKKSLKEAAELMNKTDVGCLVITDNEYPVGILTERDFVRRMVCKEKAFSTPVSEIMSSPLVVVNQNDVIWEVSEIMKNKRIHRAPVHENGKLVGIVTATDIIRRCIKGSAEEADLICENIFSRMADIQVRRD